MKTLVFLAALGLAVYWFVFRPVCGTKGALACPDPAIEEGVGQTLNAKEVCPGSGFLCNNHPMPFQVLRWPLDKGRLEVRVQLPDFAQGNDARRIQAAAIEGIMQWNKRPFPLVIKTGITFRRDIGVVWSQGMSAGGAGVARPEWEIDGKRVSFSVGGLGIVVPPAGSMSNEALFAHVRAVASHEMGHALGIMWHSERESDIMFPMVGKMNEPSARDFQTLDALYALPNGAMVE